MPNNYTNDQLEQADRTIDDAKLERTAPPTVNVLGAYANATDRVAALQAQMADERAAVQAKHAAVIAPYLADIATVDAQWAVLIEDAQAEVDELQAEIKTQVLTVGESIKHARFTASFVKGRTTWDSGKLDGYAAAHPEIERFRKTGEPSVAMRWNSREVKGQS